ncbi:MAG TPA: phosphatase PAP2 family protein [Thermoanaerobaculia bacterium]
MQLFATLDATEVVVVARVVTAAERLHLARVARVVTRLGNGWLYPFLSLLLIALGASPRVLVAITCSLLLAFAVYPRLKTSLGRQRPCDYAPALVRDVAPLDHYSCPSGHAMTAAAYATPLVVAWPAMLPFAIALCAVVGWSRVALGHHYVSDVLAGALLGLLVATPVAVVLL